MTNPCACRSVAVQDAGVKLTNYERSKAPILPVIVTSFLSFVEFPVASAIGFRRR
jgi:hypothetical protein